MISEFEFQDRLSKLDRAQDHEEYMAALDALITDLNVEFDELLRSSNRTSNEVSRLNLEIRSDVRDLNNERTRAKIDDLERENSSLRSAIPGLVQEIRTQAEANRDLQKSISDASSSLLNKQIRVGVLCALLAATVAYLAATS